MSTNDQDAVLPKETPIETAPAASSSKRDAEDDLEAGDALKKAKTDAGIVKTGETAKAEESSTSAAPPAAATEEEAEASDEGENENDEGSDDESIDDDELAGLKADAGEDEEATPAAPVQDEEPTGRRSSRTRGKRLDYAKLAQEQGGEDDEDDE